MELNSNEQKICAVCHQLLLSQYYFCPNCGTKVPGMESPLETTVSAQVKMYALSIIQPMFLYIFYSRWHGIKYFKSKDEKAHRIGQIACAILILSTIATFWFAYISFVEMEQMLQTSISNSVTNDFGL